MDTLIIDNVNLSLLERQRIALVSIALDPSIMAALTRVQRDALDGILNMLDKWSDDSQEVLPCAPQP